MHRLPAVSRTQSACPLLPLGSQILEHENDACGLVYTQVCILPRKFQKHGVIKEFVDGDIFTHALHTVDC